MAFCHRRAEEEHHYGTTSRRHQLRISPPTPPKARSSSTTSSGATGSCSSRTPRTSRPSARPSSATWRGSSPSSTSAGSRSSGSASTRSTRTRSGRRTSRRPKATRPNYPLVADPERKVADLYDMIHPKALDTLTVRSVFVIGPDKKIKLMLTYPASTGRNFDELLRVIDSLQLTSKHSVATPVNWKQGEDCIIVPVDLGRRCQEEVSRWMEGAEALPPDRAPTALTVGSAVGAPRAAPTAVFSPRVPTPSATACRSRRSALDRRRDAREPRHRRDDPRRRRGGTRGDAARAASDGAGLVRLLHPGVRGGAARGVASEPGERLARAPPACVQGRVRCQHVGARLLHLCVSISCTRRSVRRW